MKKMKKYEGGGDIESAQGENKSIDNDVRARAMAAMEKGSSEESAPAPKKATPKAESKPTPKVEAPAPKAEKASSVQQAKDVIKAKDVTVPNAKSFSESGGNTKASSTKADLSGFSFANVAKKLREKAGITSYKAGGKVSSASKRADGIAIKGKTRGKMC